MSGNVKVFLVDDHRLLRKAMVELIDDFDKFIVVGEADNGLELTKKIANAELPDIILLDINMPEMDGLETAKWLRREFPEIKVLALSMYDDERSIIKMIGVGARGYILKDAEPEELKQAFEDIMRKGYYYSDFVTKALIDRFQYEETRIHTELTSREMEFLKLTCTELTYKEIADRMNLSPRTVDGYRDALFEKLDIKSRVGLVMYAIRNGIVKV